MHVAQEAGDRWDVHVQESGAEPEVKPQFADIGDDGDGKNREVNTFEELGDEYDQEESGQVLAKIEVKELIEDPVVEGLQEPLELNVKQGRSAGDDDEQEFWGPHTPDSELLEGQVEQLWAGRRADAKCFGKHDQRRRFECGSADGAAILRMVLAVFLDGRIEESGFWMVFVIPRRGFCN